MTQQHGWGSARHVEAVVATRSVAYDEEVSSIRSGDVLVAVEQAPGVPRVVAAAQTVNIESDVPPFDEWRERRPTSPRTHSPMAVPPPGPLRRNTLTLTLGDFNDDDGQTGLTASDQLSVIKVANVIKRTTICDILITCFMCVVAKNTPSSFYAFALVPALGYFATNRYSKYLIGLFALANWAALAFSIALLFKTDTRERVASLPVVFVFTLFLGIKIMITHHSTFLLWRLRGCSEATCAALASAHSNGALIP